MITVISLHIVLDSVGKVPDGILADTKLFCEAFPCDAIPWSEIPPIIETVIRNVLDR